MSAVIIPLATTDSTKTTTGELERVLQDSFPLDHDKSSLGRAYLDQRGLNLSTYPCTLRFSTSLVYWEKDSSSYFPALIAPVVDCSGKLVSIQRTYLDHTGKKAPVANPKKLMIPVRKGALVGAAIRLFPATEAVALAEGIETALAINHALKVPTWATISATLMAKAHLPDSIRSVLIWADKDRSGTGEKSAYQLASRLHTEGRKVRVIIPDDPIPSNQKGIDWLDVLNK